MRVGDWRATAERPLFPHRAECWFVLTLGFYKANKNKVPFM